MFCLAEESGLRQGAKAMLRNHMIDETKAGEDKPPTTAEWLIDGMAAVQAVPPPKKSTWKEYAERLLQFFTPPATYNPVRVAVSWTPMEKGKSKGRSEEVSQVAKGEGCQGRRIFITQSEQSMPQGKNWSAFLSSGENETELIRFLIEYYKSQAVICIFHQSCSYIPSCNII